MPERLVDLLILEKKFRDNEVVKDVAFHVDKGEIVSLVGPSGCGKSTLLRIIRGLDGTYLGHVSVLGKTPDIRAKDIGFVFQEPRLLPWLTVAENVGFALGRKGAHHPMTWELLAEVGLSDYAHAYPKELSGGMAQRAAIARGLFTQPALLLLDEPFSAVDAFTRMRLQDLLLSLAKRHGTTLLLITHDISEAVYLSDRVITLSSRPGRLAGEVQIAAVHPRERHGATLSRLEREILKLLDGTRTAPESAGI
jgi:sulfonate transport system ATP-binding protein